MAEKLVKSDKNIEIYPKIAIKGQKSLIILAIKSTNKWDVSSTIKDIIRYQSHIISIGTCRLLLGSQRSHCSL